VFDVAKIDEHLEVRYASGAEVYLTFSGEAEHPEPREVIFADRAGTAHARRWTNRQSSYSAVRDGTNAVLIVAEAVHATAGADVEKLVDTLADEVGATWSAKPDRSLLSKTSPSYRMPSDRT
jgi:DNA/RNA-binding domain of Phe-tRNA-synthetase-like protein